MRSSVLVSLATILIALPQVVNGEILETFGFGDHAFGMSFVEIGQPNNPADTSSNWPIQPDPAGSVPYVFRCAKYAVTRELIEKANVLGNLGITLHPMAFVNGSLGVGPRSGMPATGITWNEAARFVNWLNENQGFQAAYSFSKQPGEIGYDANANIQLWNTEQSFVDWRGVNRFRHKNARYFLPSLDEWYKAAFFDASSSTYFRYTTGMNTPPIAVASGTQQGTAVYNQPLSQGPADTDEAGGLSPYGVMGLGGNSSEWQESTYAEPIYNESPLHGRGVRGGNWTSGSSGLYSFNLGGLNPEAINEPNLFYTGFRVACNPGPSPVAELLSVSFFHNSWTGLGDGIDLHKVGAREGIGLGRLTYENLCNSTHGINGVAIVIHNLWNPAKLSGNDFFLQVSPQGAFSEVSNPPSTWETAPEPQLITVTQGNNEATSQVRITWNDNVIQNRWLRLTILASPNTGISGSETYYLGHFLGETTGPQESIYIVNFADIQLIRERVGISVDASSIADIDKNGVVSFSDIGAMRPNVGAVLTNVTIP